MSLRVYNTLSRSKELFEPVRPGKVSIYLCGPTVYKPPHIGHMVGPVIFDAIKRYLRFKGYEVTWIVNITDVDDKLIDAAAKHKTSVQAMAEKYTREYLDCLALLSIDSIDRFPKASDHMQEIIDICQRLIQSGHAYAAEGNVWFDVTKDPDYGKLSHRNVMEQESGLRALEGGGKRNAADFALWKAAKPGEPTWDSPWGKGRPGWHIECSAMSMKYLGDTLDMHGGGMDLMFPHHENELAQSESFSGKPFVHFWMHNGLTKVKTKTAAGEWKSDDMHESTGNAVPSRQLIERHGPELFRYMLLSTHYRRPIDFSDEVVTASAKGLATFHRLSERLARLGIPPEKTVPDMDAQAIRLLESEVAPFIRDLLAAKMKFLEMMDDDFNTAGAIAVLHEMASLINSFLEQNQAETQRHADVIEAGGAAMQTLKNLGGVIGLFRHGIKRQDTAATEDVQKLMALLIDLRNGARQSKNFALADAIRDGLKKAGFTLEDRAGATEWRKE
ncbi:MAG TPA: cysteine--tRNA ligase [Tepidisphaeraceae bacterium]|nr:cysteine--tRNA ligase [Tepidisphaeraceae bacterium]